MFEDFEKGFLCSRVYICLFKNTVKTNIAANNWFVLLMYFKKCNLFL